MPENGGREIKLSGKKLTDPVIHLILLVIVFIISHFPFVLKGIGEPDSARIATIVIDALKNSSGNSLESYYFIDTIPLYISYLKHALVFFGNDISLLPAIMNYSNFIFGIMIIIASYLFIQKLFGSARVAFYSIFIYMFAPSFFQSTIYGAPHLIAYFFFILSLYFYLTWIDFDKGSKKYAWLTVSTAALTLTMLFKSPIILAGGIFIGLLFMRRVKDKLTIILSLSSLIIALTLFLIIRQQMTGSSAGTSTSSPADVLNWFSHFFSMPSASFFMRQIKPPLTGTGMVTSIAGTIIFFYFVLRKKSDIVVFVISWVFITNLFWLFVLGNNARHFMVSILPVTVMIVLFLSLKTPRLLIPCVALIMLGNYFILPPSPSTYYPSGNVFESAALLEHRNFNYHAKAQELINAEADKIAVLGSFHTPYVVYEILKSAPTYAGTFLTTTEKAVINIKTEQKEYMVLYVASDDPVANIETALMHYDLNSYVFASANYDLKWLRKRGMRTLETELLEWQEIPRFKSILRMK